eukprot:7701440-Pyramimonas_sp.AAC.1
MSMPFSLLQSCGRVCAEMPSRSDEFKHAAVSRLQSPSLERSVLLLAGAAATRQLAWSGAQHWAKT